MLAFFFALIGVSLILGLVGWILLFVAGSRHSVGWALSLVFGGWIAGLVFSLVHWKDAKTGFLTCLTAVLLGITGIYGSRDYLIAMVKERAVQEPKWKKEPKARPVREPEREAPPVQEEEHEAPIGNEEEPEVIIVSELKSTMENRVFGKVETPGPLLLSTTTYKLRDERAKIGEEAEQLEEIRKSIAERTKTWPTMTPEQRQALKDDATAYNQRNATLKARALELDGLEAQARMLEETRAQVERARRRVASQLVMYSISTSSACKLRKQELKAAGIPFREVLLDTDPQGCKELNRLVLMNDLAGTTIGLPSFASDERLLINNPSLSEIQSLLKENAAVR